MLFTFGSNECLLKAMNHRQVEYLVVGGIAVKSYCPERSTNDLDLLVNRTMENSRKIIDVCYDLDKQNCLRYYVNDIKAEMFNCSGKTLSLKKFLNADIIVALEEINFLSYYRNSIEAKINHIQTRIPSLCDLLTCNRIYLEHILSNPPKEKCQQEDYENRIKKVKRDIARLEQVCDARDG